MAQLLLPVIYLAFISLGLPDSLLGSAWPNLYPAFGVPVSYAGIVSMIISCGTIVSSLCSDRLTRALGTGKVTALSVAMTAAALFGFSAASAFWMLCLWAIPYGLGAGSVDAALNNYVALHYESRHMSWLHCMWGVGTIISPVLMSLALTGGQGWNGGYRIVALIQVGITAVLVLSLPLWKGRPAAKTADGTLWASSYLTLSKGVPADTAAAFAGLFYLGITVGRGFCGFVTLRFSDTQMIRLGQTVLAVGVAALLLPGPQALSLAGLVLVGLGCAPIYPSIIHSTPDHFGADRSQAVIGIQMASAYVGNLVMPPLFGLLANNVAPALFPVYLLALLILMIVMHEQLTRKTACK